METGVFISKSTPVSCRSADGEDTNMSWRRFAFDLNMRKNVNIYLVINRCLMSDVEFLKQFSTKWFNFLVNNSFMPWLIYIHIYSYCHDILMWHPCRPWLCVCCVFAGDWLIAVWLGAPVRRCFSFYLKAASSFQRVLCSGSVLHSTSPYLRERSSAFTSLYLTFILTISQKSAI